MMKFIVVVFSCLMFQSCGAKALSSDSADITSGGAVPYYVAGKNFSISESIKIALVAAGATNLNVHELKGASGGIEGYGLAGAVWYNSDGISYADRKLVVLLDLHDGLISTQLSGVATVVGSYSFDEKEPVKLIEELCTGSYQNACNLDYNKTTKAYSFKEKI